ncbi:hypothetical protein BDZ89DRAFT_1072686 [Hymenopellis radicata]|nr:hypothetical protein BDZ89DRAFT_1072686 [Hymenopellis radicata]
MADEYWKDKKNRHQTPIGKWTLASRSESQFDNILLDTKGIPFTSEIDEVLLPHRDTILRIMSDPASILNDWFSVRLKNLPERDWALCAPVAHGATLLLASRTTSCGNQDASADNSKTDPKRSKRQKR